MYQNFGPILIIGNFTNNLHEKEDGANFEKKKKKKAAYYKQKEVFPTLCSFSVGDGSWCSTTYIC